MDSLEFVWTDGMNDDFRKFFKATEEYYDDVVGGDKELGKQFVPNNTPALITQVLIVYVSERPVACAGLKKYSERAVEIKRMWVEPKYRKKGIATAMVEELGKKAKELGYKKIIIEAHKNMTEAIKLASKCDFEKIVAYPPYDHFERSNCFAKAVA
jgi:GNAT superfamily N-acetyltransferase